jgi:hypothetical protein
MKVTLEPDAVGEAGDRWQRPDLGGSPWIVVA